MSRYTQEGCAKGHVYKRHFSDAPLHCRLCLNNPVPVAMFIPYHCTVHTLPTAVPYNAGYYICVSKIRLLANMGMLVFLVLRGTNQISPLLAIHG